MIAEYYFVFLRHIMIRCFGSHCGLPVQDLGEHILTLLLYWESAI